MPTRPQRGARRHPRRPVVHYTPPSGWLNDPNGLVHLDGEYHLCYQHHPHSTDLGPMHWGHAVSTDLLMWSDLAVALQPDEHGTVFSGSAVVDHRGSAGAGTGALVACYTQYTPDAQVQSVATSIDRGRTWQPLAANPVLTSPDGVTDFRDPKLAWYDDGAGGGHWLMVLAVGNGVWCYASHDLRRWEHTGRFVPEGGRPFGVWECPDLFPVVVSGGGGGGRRWVLAVGVAANAPAGGSGTRYWVGDFDGATFTADAPARWVDLGADFYAAQSWSDVADGRRLWVAWMSNWAYADRVPAAGWRGSMTLPREVDLVDDGDGPALVQRPVAELDDRLGPALGPVPGRVVLDGGAALLRMAVAADGGADIELTAGGDRADVRYDGTVGIVAVRRAGTAADAVGADHAATHVAPVGRVTGDHVHLELLIDRGSVEVFAAGGRVCLTDLTVGIDGSTASTLVVGGRGVHAAELRPIVDVGDHAG